MKGLDIEGNVKTPQEYENKGSDVKADSGGATGNSLCQHALDVASGSLNAMKSVLNILRHTATSGVM